MIVLAAIMLSFSLHITYHYHVHHKPENKALDRFIDYMITGLLGISFQNYQIQHFMHHKYDNKKGDITSTFVFEGETKKPIPLYSYTFFWFLGLRKYRPFLKKAKIDGFLNPRVANKMNYEHVLNFLVIVILFVIDWKYGVLFGIMIYVGWFFIALHNYGQHLPEDKEIAKGYSYYGKWYNLLFMNNGLHYEHHDKPMIHYWDLKDTGKKETRTKFFHLWEPIRFVFTYYSRKK